MLLAGHKMHRKAQSKSDLRKKADLRKKMERILHTPIQDRVWQYADKKGLAGEVLQGENDIEWLAEELKELLMVASQNESAADPEFMEPQRRHRRTNNVLGRRAAVSSALAEIARQGDDVIYFRRTVLDSQLLRFEEVERWIREQRSQQVYPRAAIVRLKKGFELRRAKPWELEPPLSSMGTEQIEGLAPPERLFYATRGDGQGDYVPRCAPIGRDGPLMETSKLSSSLAKRFCWQQAQATMFLLTDVTPLLTEGVEHHPPPMIALPWRVLEPISCLTRIVMTIDPLMTPREVSQEYAKIRARLLGRKPRIQSQKHLQLGVFAVKHPEFDKEELVKAAMLEWNSQFQEWKYTRLKLFRRDAQTARKRLLNEHPVDPWKSLED